MNFFFINSLVYFVFQFYFGRTNAVSHMRFNSGKYDYSYRNISEECKESVETRLTRRRYKDQRLKGSSLILEGTKFKCGQPEYLKGSLI